VRSINWSFEIFAVLSTVLKSRGYADTVMWDVDGPTSHLMLFLLIGLLDKNNETSVHLEI
jgi:hypothetical protein